MDHAAVLAAFDEQVRRNPAPEHFGGRVEHAGGVIRVVGGGAWNGVVWSDLDTDDADAAIAAQLERFVDAGEWEWKHYSYDRPDDLLGRLRAAGFRLEPAEALLVAEIDALELGTAAPPGVQLRSVDTDDDVAAMVAVSDEVFGGDHSAIGRELKAHLSRRPPTTIGVVAMAGGTTIAAGRVELHRGTEFASLWGGSTLSSWRGRGVFRSLIAHRAAIAAEEGFRYLLVDASEQSRPILLRLGFVELATTTPCLRG